ncbi:MAG: substrate-binding domain-containing protein [bacterium]
MAKITNVLIQLAWQSAAQLDIVHGVREFMRLRPRWTLLSTSYPDPLDLRETDALILTVPLPDARVRMPPFAGPVVSVIACDRADVSIERDNQEIGRRAAFHLRERGFRQLGYVPPNASRYADTRYADARGESFAAAAQAAGMTVDRAPAVLPYRWTSGSPIARWLKDLPKPAGVFCANDNVAVALLAFCRTLAVQVPEEIGVLGVDNEEVWCETAVPPLSSISIPWRRVGYEAAQWVDRLLRGHRPPTGRRVLVASGDVVIRQSTDVVAVVQPQLARAMQLIRAHACEGLEVKELLAAVSADRRQLYRLFRQHLGRTPHEEIRRLQIEKAKELLLHTDLPQRRICQEIGMSGIYFINNFRKAVGQTPGAYRRGRYLPLLSHRPTASARKVCSPKAKIRDAMDVAASARDCTNPV